MTDAKNILVAILCGGSGSRLWPISNEDRPKQFSLLINNKSLFQHTIQRTISLNPKKIIILTNEKYRFIVKSQLPKKINVDIVLEPLSKNTAAPVAIASHIARKNNIENFLILPSDHYFKNFDSIKKEITNNSLLLNKTTLFGINPSSFDKNFGYIKFSKNFVKGFVEKPIRIPTNFFKEYLINSGIFLFNTNFFIENFNKIDSAFYKKIVRSIDSPKNNIDKDFLRINIEIFKKIEKISIDYKFLEKISFEDIKVKLIRSSWSDLGTWKNLYSTFSNKNGSLLLNSTNEENVINKNKNNIIRDSNINQKKIIINNLDQIAVLEKENYLFITKINELEKLKNISNKKQIQNDQPVYDNRPWGSYRIIEDSEDYKIKILEIDPESSISLQSHKCRSEHWVVINGRANIINGNKNYNLRKNESTFIPKNTVHKITNNSKTITLRIIEIQTGSYFGEDDIKRYD